MLKLNPCEVSMYNRWDGNKHHKTSKTQKNSNFQIWWPKVIFGGHLWLSCCPPSWKQLLPKNTKNDCNKSAVQKRDLQQNLNNPKFVSVFNCQPSWIATIAKSIKFTVMALIFVDIILVILIKTTVYGCSTQNRIIWFIKFSLVFWVDLFSVHFNVGQVQSLGYFHLFDKLKTCFRF